MLASKRIIHPRSKKILALYVRKATSHTINTFFTQEDSSLQLGIHNWTENTHIQPHIHSCVKKVVAQYQEILIIISGKILANFFDEDGTVIAKVTLSEGDILILNEVIHSFDSLAANTKIIEIKQGPYSSYVSHKLEFGKK